MKIVVIGDGRMGQTLVSEARNQGVEVCGVVGLKNQDSLKTPFELTRTPDCVIDFSHPDFLPLVAEYCSEKRVSAVIATTGLRKKHFDILKKLSTTVSVCYGANFSVGVLALSRAVKAALTCLDGFDVEILECHHRQKLDCPSGTALYLADTVSEFRAGSRNVVGRREKRKEDEIGLSVLRGGSVVGEHSVFFLGEGESLVFSHRASDKRIFALGALKAAERILGKPVGLFDAETLLCEDKNHAKQAVEIRFEKK